MHPSRVIVPIDVWEQVIDAVNELEQEGRRLRALATCCLIRRDWVPRTRLHLFKTVTLRSYSNLVGLSEALSSSPQCCSLIHRLIIDGRSSQSWISVVPLHLGCKLNSLCFLVMRNVDLSIANPRFSMLYSRFIHRPHNLRLEHLRMSNFAQVARLMAALHCWSAQIGHDPDSVSASYGAMSLLCGRPSFVQHLSLTLPWTENVIPQLCRLSRPTLMCLEKVNLHFSIIDASETRFSFGSLWEDQIELFDLLACAGTANKLIGVKVWVSALCGVELRSCGMCTSLLQYESVDTYRHLHVEPGQASSNGRIRAFCVRLFVAALDDQCMKTLARLLAAASSSSLQLRSLELSSIQHPEALNGLHKLGLAHLSDDNMARWASLREAPATASFSSRWRAVDDILCRGETVTPPLTIRFHLPLEALPRPYKCTDELVAELLPKIAAKGYLGICDGQCNYHK